MKSIKTISTLLSLILIGVIAASAQGPGTKIPKPPPCDASTAQIYTSIRAVRLRSAPRTERR